MTEYVNNKQWRKKKCLNCGYTLEMMVSEYEVEKRWTRTHTPDFCRSRANHPAVRGKMSVA